MYSLIALIIVIFLNPQQTKYFGGLAVRIKQAGLFSEYKTATFFVLYLSWFFIFLFCVFSIKLAAKF
jgi:preprotein translocase subunit SecG